MLQPIQEEESLLIRIQSITRNIPLDQIPRVKTPATNAKRPVILSMNACCGKLRPGTMEKLQRVARARTIILALIRRK